MSDGSLSGNRESIEVTYNRPHAARKQMNSNGAGINYVSTCAEVQLSNEASSLGLAHSALLSTKS